MKTHKGSKKRMKLSASGKVRYKRSCAGHLMSGKNGGRCRAMRKKSALSGKTAKRARIVLGSS